MIEKLTSTEVFEVSDADTRSKRVDKLKKLTVERFEGEQYQDLRAKIEQSFDVPQAGEFHKEGQTMDTHLDLILENVQAIVNQGVEAISDDLPESVRDLIVSAVCKNRERVEQYVLIHDLAKADTLGVTVGDQEEKLMTWEEWQAFASDVKDISDLGVTKVSYKGHAELGVAQAKDLGFDDPLVLDAVDKHMVSMAMTGISSDIYDRHFAGLNQDEIAFALTANYLDLMGSKRGEFIDPLAEFKNFIASKEKSETIRLVIAELADGAVSVQEINEAIARITAKGDDPDKDKPWLGLINKISQKGFDKNKLTKALSSMRSSKEPLNADNMAQAISAISKECKLKTYDPDAVRALGQEFFEDPTDLDEFVKVVTTDPAAIGRTFASKLGKSMGELMGALRKL
ncbi:MAG: hypothetical protein ABIH67_00530 [Candidatus Uhrbacteria bacterium]